jgi:hypothetical protein
MKVTESGDLKHSQLLFEDYLQMVSAEQREHAEVCEPPKMTETDSTDTSKQREGLLEQILNRDNLNRAYKQVKRNKGAGSKVHLEFLLDFHQFNWFVYGDIQLDSLAFNFGFYLAHV